MKGKRGEWVSSIAIVKEFLQIGKFTGRPHAAAKVYIATSHAIGLSGVKHVTICVLNVAHMMRNNTLETGYVSMVLPKSVYPDGCLLPIKKLPQTYN